MKSVVLVVASLLVLGSALPVPEDEVIGKPEGLTAEQLELLFSANPEDNDIDHSEPMASPLPLNLNQKVEDEAEPVPVPAEDTVEEIQEQEVPKEIDESENPSENEEPVAPEGKLPAEDDEEIPQEEVVPEETPELEQPVVPIISIEPEVPNSQEESLPPADYAVPEEPIIIEDPVAPLEPEVGEEPQAPFDEVFEVPERYRTPLFPIDSGYDSYSTAEQEPIIKVVPIDEVGLVGVMDGDEDDFSVEETDFENDGPDLEQVEDVFAGNPGVDQDGVITGSEITEIGPAPVVVGYEDEGFSQDPIVNEDYVPEDEMIEEEPQVFFVPENEGEVVEEEGVPVDFVVSPEEMPFDDQIETEELDPEYHPEVEFENPEYPVPAVGTIFVDDDQEELEDNNEGVYFVPSQPSEGFATDEGVFGIEENPGSVFYIPENEPQDVDVSPMTDDRLVVLIDENENPKVLVVGGEDDEGDRFAVAMEENENGEIQREVLVAELAGEDSSEEHEDVMPMEDIVEGGYDEDHIDGVAILDGEDEDGEVQPEVSIAEIPMEPLSGEHSVYDVPMKGVFVVEEKGPNEEVLALAVEDENGDIHGEIIDAEFEGEGFPSEPFPGEGTLPEDVFVSEEDSNEEPDLEIDVDEHGEVHVVGVPETEDMFPEDTDGPLVEFTDAMDDETDEEPYPVMLEENDEEVLPIEGTSEDVDEEGPFVVMGFDDEIVPVIAPVEIYPVEELRPLPPVEEYPFSPELPMDPEEEIAVLPGEVPFGVEIIEDENEDEYEDENEAILSEILPEDFEDENEGEYEGEGEVKDGGEDEDESVDGIFELDQDLMAPGVILNPMEKPETPEIFLTPQEIVGIVPYEDQFMEDQKPIIFPIDDGPKHNLPIFPYQQANRVSLPLFEKLPGNDEGYYSDEEDDEVQQPWVERPMVGEAMEPQVLQVPDKTMNNQLPIAGIPSQIYQQQQTQVPMYHQNQNQYQRYSPAFTDDTYQMNRNAPSPMRSSYSPYPFSFQYNPKYSQVSTYYDVFNRQPYTPQFYYEGHMYDDDSFYDHLMHDDVPIYFEQPTYYNTRQIQNPFLSYKGYAASSVPSYNEYSRYA